MPATRTNFRKENVYRLTRGKRSKDARKKERSNQADQMPYAT